MFIHIMFRSKKSAPTSDSYAALKPESVENWDIVQNGRQIYSKKYQCLINQSTNQLDFICIMLFIHEMSDTSSASHNDLSHMSGNS